MIDNKQRKATALKYDPAKDSAPRVTAKGKGLMAEKIIELAGKEGIPVSEDPDLVEALIQLDFYEEIPPQLYKSVAEILAFAYKLNRKLLEKSI